jgi:hypothetical protein
MNWKQQADDGHVDVERASQLERLVCGELDEHSRGSLIAWLDEEARRWRLCGVMFLESQAWSQAMNDWPGASLVANLGVQRRENYVAKCESERSSSRRRSLFYTAVLAASVVVSFLAGFAASAGREQMLDVQVAGEGAIPSDVDRATVIAALPVESSLGPLAASAVHVPVVREQSATQDVHRPASDIPDYIRQQWRRRGYELNVQRRYLFAQLPDGERVAVPVDQYSFTHVPPKIN